MRGDLLTDETIEAFFAGSSDPAWEHNESLATLANDMAMVVDAPGPVANHALRQLFWETAAAAETATVVATPSRAVARTGDGGDRRSSTGEEPEGGTGDHDGGGDDEADGGDGQVHQDAL